MRRTGWIGVAVVKVLVKIEFETIILKPKQEVSECRREVAWSRPELTF